MVLTIVLDVYKDVRARGKKSEPVWTTLMFMGQQLWHCLTLQGDKVD